MIKKNVWITVVSMFALLTAAFLFIGCELDTPGTDLADTASRSLSSASGPTPFTAFVLVEQKEGYTTEPMGSGDRWRTTDEVLEGTILMSNWDVLDQKTVVMSNFTNFHFFVDGYIEGGIPYGEVSGTNHSSIEILSDEGALIMTMKANGKMAGYFPVFADLDMDFISTGPGPNVRGELSGQFFWSIQSEEMAEAIQQNFSLPALPDKPFGIFELTGVFR